MPSISLVALFSYSQTHNNPSHKYLETIRSQPPSPCSYHPTFRNTNIHWNEVITKHHSNMKPNIQLLIPRHKCHASVHLNVNVHWLAFFSCSSKNSHNVKMHGCCVLVEKALWSHCFNIRKVWLYITFSCHFLNFFLTFQLVFSLSNTQSMKYMYFLLVFKIIYMTH